MELGIKGRKAIVAGGSAGMGKESALALAREGVDVFLSARGDLRLHASAQEIAQATGARVVPVVADHGTTEGRARLLAACPDPDILVITCSPPRFLASYLDPDPDEWAAALSTTLLGPVELMDERRRWAFRLGPSEKFSTDLVADDVKRHKGTTIGVIALSSAYGDGFVKAMEASAAAKGVKIAGVERYNVTDQSVTAQIAKLALLNPDAIYIASAGTAGALPQIELSSRGYAGRVYQTGGVANADFLRVAGKAAEGMYVTVLPLLVAEQLKQDDPLRISAEAFAKAYEGKHGAGTRSAFAAGAYDSYRLIENAAKIALRKAQPGTEAFRAAMRDGMEQTRDLKTTTLHFAFSEDNHSGMDHRSQVLAVVKGGKWTLAD